MKFEFEGSYDVGRRARCIKAPDALPQLVGMVGEIYFPECVYQWHCEEVEGLVIMLDEDLEDWDFQEEHGSPYDRFSSVAEWLEYCGKHDPSWVYTAHESTSAQWLAGHGPGTWMRLPGFSDVLVLVPSEIIERDAARGSP